MHREMIRKAESDFRKRKIHRKVAEDWLGSKKRSGGERGE